MNARGKIRKDQGRLQIFSLTATFITISIHKINNNDNPKLPNDELPRPRHVVRTGTSHWNPSLPNPQVGRFGPTKSLFF